MEKRVFIAIFLSFVVLAAYQALFPTPPAVPAAATSVAPAAVPGPAGPTTSTAVGTPVPSTVPSAPNAAPLVGDIEPRQIVVETDAIRAVFSNVGATLQSWTFKHYAEQGRPLELVPQDVPADAPKAFAIATNDGVLSRTLATALFRPSTTGLSLGAAPGILSFEYSDQSGLNARKTFHFQPDGKAYVLKVEAMVDVGGTSRPVTLNSGLALGLGYEPDGSKPTPTRAVQFRDGKVDRLAASALTTQPRYDAEMKFAGVDSHYFLNAVLPGTERVAVEYTPTTLPVPGDTENLTREFISYTVSTPGPLSFAFFLGPKDFDILRDVDPRLELVRAIDFGIFAWLVVPLLQALKWINGFLGNYGWSIVALTLFINLVIFPLRHKSMVSMRKMQALQPEVKGIQERYAKFKLTDPERQKMNQEMMALYKQKGVNPASGCVPMLLTLPVLFAFYAMLSASIELRGAPFVGWITDLARHDPLYITPILMGLSMLWQQRMMPSTADPIQQKIFLLMPVIFTVSFLRAPAGLVVYWFASNLLAIGQQYLTNRMIGEPTRPVLPRRKPAG